MTSKIELSILALSKNFSNTHSHAIILGEKNGFKKLSILIGYYEAQAITIALEKIQIKRPLTHDLITNIFNLFNFKVQEILIYNYQDGIYFCHIIGTHNTLPTKIEARLSDAIAIATRTNTPIFIEQNIFNTNSSSPQPTTKNTPQNPLSQFSNTELKKKLDECLINEDYLLAAQIRDELNTRK